MTEIPPQAREWLERYIDDDNEDMEGLVQDGQEYFYVPRWIRALALEALEAREGEEQLQGIDYDAKVYMPPTPCRKHEWVGPLKRIVHWPQFCRHCALTRAFVEQQAEIR